MCLGHEFGFEGSHVGKRELDLLWVVDEDEEEVKDDVLSDEGLDIPEGMEDLALDIDENEDPEDRFH